MPIYADDGQFLYLSKRRYQNQDKLENCYWKICIFLNANGLKVNDGKTHLTEYMSRQKRTQLQGIPPDLTVHELITDKDGNEVLEDSHITDKSQCKLLGLTMQNDLTWGGHLSTGSKPILPAVRRIIGTGQKIIISKSIYSCNPFYDILNLDPPMNSQI